MSLFLGNLSDHIHQEDLEHVFRRFGRCSVRMKDGYGFVVFEERFNAEKALRTLRGKLICGEQINLSWSNKQPRNFQKFTRNSRFYEPYHRRNFRDSDSFVEHDRRDFGRPQSTKQRAFRMPDMYSREVGHAQNTDPIVDAEGQQTTGKVGAANEYNPDEDGRWGEPVNRSADDILMGNSTDFERYEPNGDYDGKDFDGNVASGSYGSPARSRSLEKHENSGDAQVKNFDTLRQQPVCYNCGLLGHIMRNCPRGTSSRIDKSSRFQNRKFHGKDGGRRGIEAEPNRKFYDARRETGGDTFLYEQHLPSSSGIHQKNRKQLQKGSHKFTDVDSAPRNKKREASPSRKRNDKFDQGSPKKKLKNRKSNASVSLDTDSNRTTPAHSVTSGSKTRTSQTNSRSASSRPSYSRPNPSKSRSASVSSQSRSKHHRWRSRSRSLSRSRSRSRMSIPESLSVSLDRKSAFSEQKVDAVDSDIPISDQQRDSSIPNIGLSNKNMPSPGQKLNLDADAANVSNEPCDALLDSHQDLGMEDEIVSEHNDISYFKDAQVISLENPSGNKDTADSPITYPNPNMDSFGTPDVSKSKGLSTGEAVMVMEHYGLEIQNNCEKGSSVGTMFGAVRFWPWELIYYRRLKKGPISTENYARRVQQNNEFGIVDKYIRSSSGWGACTENDQ